jgi:hypothetical protein
LVLSEKYLICGKTGHSNSELFAKGLKSNASSRKQTINFHFSIAARARALAWKILVFSIRFMISFIGLLLCHGALTFPGTTMRNQYTLRALNKWQRDSASMPHRLLVHRANAEHDLIHAVAPAIRQRHLNHDE